MLRKFLVLFALPVVVAVLLPGCLEAEKSILVRYDKPADTFHVLVMFQHIRGGEVNGNYTPKADLAHLENLYKNRDHLVFMPHGSPWIGAMFGESAWVRNADRLVSSVPLSQASTDIKPEPVPFSLNAITIKPGQFFFREPGNLCYYHAISVPGMLLDQMMDAGFAQFAQGALAQELNSELDRRLKENTKPNWEQFRHDLIAHTCKQIEAGVGAAPADDAWEPEAPFATDTLQRILESATKKQLVVKRAGSQLSLIVPMTAVDVEQTIKTADEFRKTVAAKIAQLKPKDEANARVARWYQKLLEIPQLSAADKEHLEVRIDIVQTLSTFDGPSDPAFTLDEKAKARTLEMADLVAARLPIAKGVTVGQLVADFQAGKLEVNPSKPPVQPGDGLIPKQ